MHTWWRWLLETWGFNTAPDYLPWTYSHLWWSWHSLGFNEDANYPPYSSLGGAGYIWGVTRLQIIYARLIVALDTFGQCYASLSGCRNYPQTLLLIFAHLSTDTVNALPKGFGTNKTVEAT